jgi:hypothetical protein
MVEPSGGNASSPPLSSGKASGGPPSTLTVKSRTNQILKAPRREKKKVLRLSGVHARTWLSGPMRSATAAISGRKAGCFGWPPWLVIT